MPGGKWESSAGSYGDYHTKGQPKSSTASQLQSMRLKDQGATALEWTDARRTRASFCFPNFPRQKLKAWEVDRQHQDDLDEYAAGIALGYLDPSARSLSELRTLPPFIGVP